LLLFISLSSSNSDSIHLDEIYQLSRILKNIYKTGV
jgi:hypothetical protein